MEKLELKLFGEREWDCFAGASGSFPKICWDVKINEDTFPPEYRGAENWLIVIDTEGIQLMGNDIDGEDVGIFALNLRNQALSELVVKAIKYPINYEQLIKLGFMDIS